MSRISATQPIQQSTQIGDNDLRDLEISEFLELMIAELQNQDPLDPMDNSELLAQINTIREISATNELSDTLGAVLTGQNLSTASSLIGKTVRALDDQAENVEGVVDRVSVEFEGEGDAQQRVLRVHIGEHRINLDNVREIVSESLPSAS